MITWKGELRGERIQQINSARKVLYEKSPRVPELSKIVKTGQLFRQTGSVGNVPPLKVAKIPEHIWIGEGSS
jgi:hypothetical protein